MNKEKFRLHLNQATLSLIDLAKKLCVNEFSDNYKYIITPNSRIVLNGDNHLNEKETTVLKIWNKYEGQILSAELIVDLLHHDNKVPLWINTTIFEANNNQTVIDLFCSRRLRDENELMHPNFPPFHVLLSTPTNNLLFDNNEKFDVNWKKNQSTNKRT